MRSRRRRQNGPDPRVVSNAGFDSFTVPIPAGATISATGFRNGTVDGSGAWTPATGANQRHLDRQRPANAQLGHDVFVLADRERVAAFEHADGLSKGNGSVTLHVANTGTPASYSAPAHRAADARVSQRAGGWHNIRRVANNQPAPFSVRVFFASCRERPLALPPEHRASSIAALSLAPRRSNASIQGAECRRVRFDDPRALGSCFSAAQESACARSAPAETASACRPPNRRDPRRSTATADDRSGRRPA